MVTATFVPVDGRLTSLQVLNISLTGGEVMEIVSPGTAAAGNNFQVTTAILGAYFSALPYINTRQVAQGSTAAIATTDTRILITSGSAATTSITAPSASTMLAPFPILIKDTTGDAAINPITITFTGGELCDGLSSLVIDNAYGWTTINPLPGGGGWYQS
jgi:hypothetical protein